MHGSLGYEFRGYRLGEGRRPTFLYDIGDVHVEDTLVPDSKDQFTPVTRTLSISATSAVHNLWYRAAVGDSIEPAGGGWYIVNESWRVRLNSEVKLRKSAGKVELLVPVHCNDARVMITHEYAW